MRRLHLRTGTALLFQFFIHSTFSKEPWKLPTNLLPRCSCAVVPIETDLFFTDDAKIARRFRPTCLHLRGGCVEGPSSSACLPVMGSLIRSASTRASNCARVLHQLGTAAAGWISELHRMRSFSSLESAMEPEPPAVAEPFAYDAPPADDRGSWGGSAEQPQPPTSYDVLLSCLPRGVTSRRVQVDAFAAQPIRPVRFRHFLSPPPRAPPLPMRCARSPASSGSAWRRPAPAIGPVPKAGVEQLARVDNQRPRARAVSPPCSPLPAALQRAAFALRGRGRGRGRRWCCTASTAGSGGGTWSTRSTPSGPASCPRPARALCVCVCVCARARARVCVVSCVRARVP